MRILYLSQYFPPEMGAPSARVYELSRRWVQNGAEVTVLTGFPNHPTGVIPPEYQGFKRLFEKKDGINVVRTYIFAAANKGFFKRILSYISFAISSVILGIGSTGKQDIIIATSPQFFVGISGYVISKIKRIPFVFEIRDLWPESIIQLGLIKNKLIIRFLEAIELFLYRKAVKIIAVADSTIDILKLRGIDINKISIIKNAVDLKLFSPITDQLKLKTKFDLKGKFIVSYIGTIGLSHALDKVLEAAKVLRDQTDILFMIVGEGAEKENLLKKASNEQINNVIFFDQISKEQLPEYYSLSDLVLVTLKDLELFRHVIPSKIFEIMAMRRPMIVSVDGEAKKISVDDAKAGLFSNPEDIDMLVKNILHLFNNNDLRDELALNGRRYVEQYFDRNKLADQYLNILDNIK